MFPSGSGGWSTPEDPGGAPAGAVGARAGAFGAFGLSVVAGGGGGCGVSTAGSAGLVSVLVSAGSVLVLCSGVELELPGGSSGGGGTFTVAGATLFKSPGMVRLSDAIDVCEYPSLKVGGKPCPTFSGLGLHLPRKDCWLTFPFQG